MTLADVGFIAASAALVALALLIERGGLNMKHVLRWHQKPGETKGHYTCATCEAQGVNPDAVHSYAGSGTFEVRVGEDVEVPDPEPTVGNTPLRQVREAMHADAGKLDGILAERGSRYGNFRGHADITCSIKDIMEGSPSWSEMQAYQQEALAMVAHKIGRVCNGDPDYADSWQDIAGYAQLVVDILEGKDP